MEVLQNVYKVRLGWRGWTFPQSHESNHGSLMWLLSYTIFFRMWQKPGTLRASKPAFDNSQNTVKTPSHTDTPLQHTGTPSQKTNYVDEVQFRQQLLAKNQKRIKVHKTTVVLPPDRWNKGQSVHSRHRIGRDIFPRRKPMTLSEECCVHYMSKVSGK